MHRSQGAKEMDDFEEVLEQYNPMIYSVLRKARIYKNREHFCQVARIALWQAWQHFDPAKGSFAPYAQRMMLTSLYTAMRKDNQYSERQIPYENDKLTLVAQYTDVKNMPSNAAATLETVAEFLTEDEFELLKDLYYHQYKYEELTHKYNASVDALKKRRARILKKIRMKLN
ncbi:sigma-70 family RNA polymerase sigma factor [Ureibacillus aquaedulcis]|uniref:Sigma-70 family RNA polymerase sigma factor n=1 Tax=Ureibacillus aquaedulcis TaxID=3058421 RepID=A0ABT8GUM5_9BACL|nr:sigma-70 family RNA polymerase sigma factor [Ureibacillus sp. BA0131]MDN4495120.1 sigma-70 family RNA polymerase sigma factor [Ureibacillus sp. BA0131]